VCPFIQKNQHLMQQETSLQGCVLICLLSANTGTLIANITFERSTTEELGGACHQDG
jgi:hypothetical protein